MAVEALESGAELAGGAIATCAGHRLHRIAIAGSGEAGEGAGEAQLADPLHRAALEPLLKTLCSVRRE